MKLVSPNFKDLMQPNIEIGNFPDGDTHVYIPDISKYRNQEVSLFHRLYPNQNQALMELFLVLSALKNINAKVTVVAPYLPYARQDKVFLDGETASAEIVCNLIKDSGCEKLVTFDCHFLKKEGEFTYGNLKIKNISLDTRIIEYVKEISQGEDCVMVAPDEGASYMVEKRGGEKMRKYRSQYSGNHIDYREIEKMEATFDVDGKNVLILDDMISTGSTMLKAVETLRGGGAKKIYCAATHGFFLKDSLEKLQKVTDGVFVSDSILSSVSLVSIGEYLKELD